MRAEIGCRDGCEAQRLAGLAYAGGRGGGARITGILNVIGDEIVVSVSDGSAHSIVLRDGPQAEAFADFLQSVLEKRHRITGAEALADLVRITKE